MSKKKESDEMEVSVAAEQCNMSVDALRKAIKRGLLAGVKRKGKWYTTQAALESWRANRIHKQGRPKKIR